MFFLNGSSAVKQHFFALGRVKVLPYVHVQGRSYSWDFGTQHISKVKYLNCGCIQTKSTPRNRQQHGWIDLDARHTAPTDFLISANTFKGKTSIALKGHTTLCTLSRQSIVPSLCWIPI